MRIIAQHLLNKTPNWTLGFLKVSVKKPAENYFYCMTTKQWVENQNRKHIVARELINLRPLLALFESKKYFNVEIWKKFKPEYNVTRQTIAMFLSVLRNNFFSN